MTLQPTFIANYQSGLAKNKKPFLLMDDAFQSLKNAYVWRERVKRREGIKLVGRLRRTITAVTLTNQALGATYVVADVFADAAINLRATEANAEIEPGSVSITVGAIVFTDVASDGLLTDGGTNTGSINYASGALELDFAPALGVNTNVDVTFNYFPALPVMGINKREISTINDEQTLYFDTKYVYTYDGTNFNENANVIWSGSDSQIFWGENYRGSTPQERLHFTTNAANPASNTNNRIRYTSNATTWTDFTPVIGTTSVTNEAAAGNPYAASPINFSLGSIPVVPGSVKITATDTVTGDVIGFRDVAGVYPAGTLTGAPSTNSGTIDYSTGAVTLTIPTLPNPVNVQSTYQKESQSMFQSSFLISYYGRLLAFAPWEGADAATAVQIFNRVRFSQVGNPLERNAWITSIPGRGGFIDAPTNESVISARFYKNTLIVFFESSTWQLRYVGEVGFPFLWERISSDLGSESKFSTILFDKGILGVGDKAIISSSGNGVERIDLSVPDEVFEISNVNSGKERIVGVRDYYKEIVYWTFPDGGLARKFPNRTLLFNYRNASWAVFRDNVTALGEQTSPTGVSWDSATEWDSNTSWDGIFPQGFPVIVAGNQQGYIHWYHFIDPEDTADTVSDMAETESLAIKSITLSAANPIRINVPNHNLENGEIVYLTGVMFLNTALTATVATDLNNKFYYVVRVDDDNLDLFQYNFSSKTYGSTAFDQIAYSPDPATLPQYVGVGQLTLVQNMEIITKDFNPYQTNGKQICHSYTDFQVDSSPNSAISVEIRLDNAPGVNGNLLVGNTQTNTAVNLNGNVTNITQALNAVVTAPNHGLETGRKITFRDVPGMTQVNGLGVTVTKIDENSFTIATDSSAFSPYTAGGIGEWITTDVGYYIPKSEYSWHRFFATTYGQYLAFRLFYDDDLMNVKETHQSRFELNAMTLWSRAGGRISP